MERCWLLPHGRYDCVMVEKRTKRIPGDKSWRQSRCFHKKEA